LPVAYQDGGRGLAGKEGRKRFLPVLRNDSAVPGSADILTQWLA
jgi:hypothetical protein